jgi:hypothetical protein
VKGARVIQGGERKSGKRRKERDFFEGDNGILQKKKKIVDKIWRGKELMLTWQLHSQRLSSESGRT